MKKTLLTLLILGFSTTILVGCTSSNDNVAESEDVTEKIADEGSEISDDLAKEGETSASVDEKTGGEEGVSSDATGATAGEEEEVLADLGDDEGLDKLDEEVEGKTSESTSETSGEIAEASETSDVSVASTDTPTSVEPPAPVTESTSVDAPSTDFAAAGGVVGSDFASSGTTTKWPLRKVKDTPFRQGGTMLNTVYLARKGDTLKSVSQKIYGSNRRSELLKMNPYLSRGVKTGDKIYYNSPQRSLDAERMLTFYEDRGIPSEVYVAKAGDNIRQLGSTLLGDRESWKELWATNPAVESKSELAEGTELRYWPVTAASLAVPPPPPELPIAKNEFSSPPPVSQPPDFPPQADIQKSAPPMPPPPAVAEPLPSSGGLDTPPPAAEQPLAAAAAQANPSNNESENLNKEAPAVTENASFMGVDLGQDTTFLLGAGGLLIVGGGLLLMVVRKSRSRRLGEGQTQI